MNALSETRIKTMAAQVGINEDYFNGMRKHKTLFDILRLVNVMKLKKIKAGSEVSASGNGQVFNAIKIGTDK